jgi:DNA/RNA-binding domain of Phe-tRNA-synthetase-like protein
VTLLNDSLVMWAVGIRDSVSMRIEENTKRVLVVSVQLA